MLYKDMTQEQREADRLRRRRWVEINQSKVRLAKRANYEKNKAKYIALERDRQYRLRYGISVADYDAMLIAQGGGCDICASKTAGLKGQAFAVDHCHTTGQVRGLLCLTCNVKLGTIEWYRKNAAMVDAYLARFEGMASKAPLKGDEA